MSDSQVKSAKRVLDILEYFANRRAPAGVSELADALGYPRSSTSMLLASLVDMGYLRQDAQTRRFAPTARVALLGAWIETDTGVQACLQRLRERTGETVILAQRKGLDSQYIQVLESTADIRLILRMGTRRRLVRAATGYVLLAGLADAEVLRILHRSNADAPAAEQVSAAELLHSVNQVRAHGVACVESRYTRGATMIAARLPMAADGEPLAVAVGGPSERLGERRDAIVAALHEMVGTLPATPRRHKLVG